MSLKWNDKEFKKRLLANLVSNAEIVGKFVESDAKKRILSYQEPDWGEGHRKYVSKSITHVVEQEERAVVIKVGLPHGKRRKDGTPTRHLGFYIEFGSRTAPAHPYLRPAVFENGRQIVKLLSGR